MIPHNLFNLQSENLTSLVEYLDSVSPHIIFPCTALKIDEGSRRYFQSSDPRISGILA